MGCDETKDYHIPIAVSRGVEDDHEAGVPRLPAKRLPGLPQEEGAGPGNDRWVPLDDQQGQPPVNGSRYRSKPQEVDGGNGPDHQGPGPRASPHARGEAGDVRAVDILTVPQEHRDQGHGLGVAEGRSRKRPLAHSAAVPGRPRGGAGHRANGRASRAQPRAAAHRGDQAEGQGPEARVRGRAREGQAWGEAPQGGVPSLDPLGAEQLPYDQGGRDRQGQGEEPGRDGAGQPAHLRAERAAARLQADGRGQDARSRERQDRDRVHQPRSPQDLRADRLARRSTVGDDQGHARSRGHQDHGAVPRSQHGRSGRCDEEDRRISAHCKLQGKRPEPDKKVDRAGFEPAIRIWMRTIFAPNLAKILDKYAQNCGRELRKMT